MSNSFKAYVVRENDQNLFSGKIERKNFDDLPKGDLTVNVKYSSLNYKDALSISGNKGVTKVYPHTPGIDAAGIVENSENPIFNVGDKVVVTGYDLGMNTSGGFSEYIRIPSSWAVKLPENLSLKYSMALGTAGLTAGLCINLLSDKNGIAGKKAVVTGATGGVSCISIQLLSKLGANVTAVSGKQDSHDFLTLLGADQVISREKFSNYFRQPLSRGVWDIGVDVVGGNTLAGLMSCLKSSGSVACCGNVGGVKFETSVFPFILRGNSLLGVDSAERAQSEKNRLWDHFSTDWKIDNIEKFTKIVSLENIEKEIERILAGGQKGRVIISI